MKLRVGPNILRNAAFLSSLTFSIHMFAIRETNHGSTITRTRKRTRFQPRNLKGYYKLPRGTPIKMQLVPSLQDQGTKRRFTSTLVSHPYQELCPNTRSLLSMSSRRCRESIASSRSWITRIESRASPPMIHPFLPQFPSTGKPLTDSAFPAFRRMRDLDR